ncbi:hypothetical protein SAMN05192583_2781 [Sphingomonas gellani]|uniref:TonB-dependent receptor n=1 Tax=Sphingomonas gellani TaxID=1166340 RepID=A0A1H8GJB7_9SPHN|nr:TonB-dependent receptor [Sphingomonas gellani]SEN43899.1 hypothetical protein SAMN05192583_2781 [Sphingomonas gellani]
MRTLGIGLMAVVASPAVAQQVSPPAASAVPVSPAAPDPQRADPTQPGVAAPEPAPAPETPQAQQAAAQEEDTPDEPDIIVQGRRNLPGAVIGDIPPEVQLGPSDIRSYGVSSVSELLDELAPQTRSGRGSGGRPVVLLNGRRISGFQEVRDLPTEAIARVDILPEEVALKYGYRADQRVVNFVLRRRFRAATVELADRIPTSGGRNTANPRLDLLGIANGGRVNLHLDYTASSPLTEAERGITQQPSLFGAPGNIVATGSGVIDPLLGTGTVVGVPGSFAGARPILGDFAGVAPTSADQGAYRTLLGSSRQFNANATYARSFGSVGATLNGTLEVSDNRSTLGLPSLSLTLPAGNPYSPFANTVTLTQALSAFDPLEQRGSSISAHLGTTVNGSLGGWQWNVTGSYDRIASDTDTDLGIDARAFQDRLNAGDPTANPFAAFSAATLGAGDFSLLPGNRGHSLSTEGAINALVTGSPVSLPAGPITTSLRVGGTTSDLSSRSFRSGVTTRGDVSRDIASGQLNIDLPITSRDRAVLGAIGTLSLNANLGIDQLSDFGTLTTVGYGANWSPIEGVRVIASHTDDENAPSAAQLGNPTVVTPNVRVFDYVSGANAVVTTITGGNPLLNANNSHTTKIGLTVKPLRTTDLTLSANYVNSDTDDVIAGFPTPTAAIEAAFPQRFLRGADGQLLQLDSRPINFARSERSELRYGFNLSVPLKSSIQKQLEAFRAGTGPNPFAGLRPPGGGRGPWGGDGRGDARSGGQADGNAARAPGGNGAAAGGNRGDTAPAPGQAGGAVSGPGGPGGGRFGGPGGGGGGFRGRGGAGGRLQFALYHTWHFTDRVDIGANGPFLDLLNGDAIGQTGGQPRHELEGQAGYSNNGLGARLSVNYQSGTTVNGGTPASPNVLDFSSLTTANLRLFADFGGRLDLFRKHPWLRGTRLTVSFDNLFNQRQQVRDARGVTPISFQPGYLDPLGRSVRLSIRKLFF